MAHIQLPEGLPGIVGPLKAFPETGHLLSQLADELLGKETTSFSKAERETVASYVSYLNGCLFCSESHAAVADVHWNGKLQAKNFWKDSGAASPKLKAFLSIAEKVTRDPKSVSKADVDQALKAGASEKDVHDTVLIAAAFNMYNRYVEGLHTFAPPAGHPGYREMGETLASGGYVRAIR